MVPTALVIRSIKREANIAPEKLLFSTLILTGTISLALSTIYTSSFLALIGLGLLFCGIILSYIRTEEYVKKILLDKSNSSHLAAVNKLISDTEFAGNAVFLPPNYFKSPNLHKVYISKVKDTEIPTRELMYKQEPQLFIEILEEPMAILLTPPGAELASLFEEELKTGFPSRVNLRDIQANLSKFLTEDLEMVKGFEMNIEKNTIQVRIERSVYREQNTYQQQLSGYFSFGSPLTSAIACILATASGNPVIIVKTRTSSSGEDIIVEYHILDQAEQQVS
jgi:hypothetical protein